MEDKKEFITKAINFAKERHKGQLDDDGKDYFEAHLMRVGYAIHCFTIDVEVIAAAYLHDILEDTETTYIELKILFGKRVAELVNEVTDEGEKDSYGKYFPRLKSKDGILIKLIDRASNISRMDNWDKKRQDHYLKKTKFWKDGGDRNENKQRSE